MRSPQDMQIIQIDITNACPFTCSNCTRMCGHHAKTFMMDFETFQRAVDSLEGYEGSISMMGGEPTLHPEFEKFALYLASKYPHLYQEDSDRDLLHPMDDFFKTVQDVQLNYTVGHSTEGGDIAVVPAPCLYSMMGKSYMNHFEFIQDVFKKQVLNDHSNEMFHQPALVSRKDLGIDDETFFEQRDNCWIQNTWSASVTPKGAFFCEIAGALDMLLDGPGGWAIEKDWWKRQPKDFEDQFHWCELCGFACETFTRNANESIDDVSATLYEKLLKVNSPKVKAGKVNVIKIENGVIAEESKASEFTYSARDLETGAPYIKYLAEKVDKQTSITHPRTLVALLVLSDATTEEELKQWATSNKELYDHVVAFCPSVALQTTWDAITLEGTQTESYVVEDASFGHTWNKLLAEHNDNYLFVLSPTTFLTKEFIQRFKASTPNRGALIHSSWLTAAEAPKEWVTLTGNGGYIGIFHPKASSLREIGFDRRVRAKSFPDVFGLWNAKKTISLNEEVFVSSSRERIQEGERCAIFGAGGRSSDIFFLIAQQKATCVAIVDSNPEKQGRAFEHLAVTAPDSLKELEASIDRVLIGSPIFYKEMKEKLIELGFPLHKITQV